MTKHEELRRLALQTKPLVDGSTKSLNAFYHAASPDVVLALLDEIARKDALLRECKTAIDGTAKSIVANRGLAPAMFYILLEAIEKELT